jgi:hypothetical protein
MLLLLILTIDLDRPSSRLNKGFRFEVKQRSKLRGIRPNYLIQQGSTANRYGPLKQKAPG